MTAPGGKARRTAAPLLRQVVTPEDTLHASTVDLLAKLVMEPAEWAAYPAGHIKLDGQQAAKLARMGLKRSWPDFLISHNGMLGIELKTQDGRLSISRWITVRDRRGNIVKRWVEGQREVFPRLVASGGFKHIAVCQSLDEVMAALRAFGVPVRGQVAA